MPASQIFCYQIDDNFKYTNNSKIKGTLSFLQSYYYAHNKRLIIGVFFAYRNVKQA